MEIPEHELKELLLDIEKLEEKVTAQIRRLKIGIKILMDPNPPSRKPVVIHSPYVNQRKKASAQGR